MAGRARASHDNIGYKAAQIGLDELLQSIDALRGIPMLTEQVAQVDSKDMGFDVWRQLALRCAHWLAQDEVRGIVITHGTDTLEETAYFLQSVLAPSKPVVLTCAMRPATALAPDGPQNLVDAVAVASLPDARGVVAVCAGVVHAALDVQKVHTYRVDAFSSGDAGPLGYVEEGALRQLRIWPAPGAPSVSSVLNRLASVPVWPRVEIVMNYAGASGAIVDALVAQGVAGLVVAATGNGTLHHELQAALLRHQADGLSVVRATRCSQGRVLPIAGDPIVDSQGLSPVKARIALMLRLLVQSSA